MQLLYIMCLLISCPFFLNLSALRALGIPSRPITNFESAHDADLNRAIDYYFDENDKMLADRSSDSIWLVATIHMYNMYILMEYM